MVMFHVKKILLLLLLGQVVSSHAGFRWDWLKFKRQTHSEPTRPTNRDVPQNDAFFLHQQASPSLLEDPPHNSVGRRSYDATAVAKTAVQWSLLLFLARSIWQAFKDVAEEIASMDDSEDDSKLLKVPLSKVGGNKETSLIHRIAWKLSQCGIPLQSSTERSVESLLQTLTKNEAALLDQCLYIPSAHPKIAGFTEIQEDLQSMLNQFLRQDNTNQHPYSRLFDDDKSHHVLLYGPPGMGKSLLIKRLATQIPTVLLTPSVLLRKWVGDTNLRVRTLFTALQKLAPVMLCLDEVDGLFRERQLQEHEVSRDLKTEFLQWWDGLLSGEKIWIVAATNRPFEVDSAVLRRLPRQFFIDQPNLAARKKMLSNLLEGLPHDIDVEHVALHTNGFSASDLRRLLQVAAKGCKEVDTYVKMTTGHVLGALEFVQPTPQTPAYRAALQKYLSPQGQQARSPYIEHYRIEVDFECDSDADKNVAEEEDITDDDTDDDP
ncbi:hypothetical protein FisN_21Hh192 [Fistulifera solaris]|uniref:AAA+ ATPase domain-containing protein n=1 Tax=Fistulifera solaris TaxID=1519565 RepID=A0A1Z5JS80_FISSO|nr:hypothetical protein FisN_21Hh192 [Fistulifera solaris]|eukprot:GAX16746.1 hypothetical protein FisN_21Hh192 [Fistulifera solaris]